jgi:hypothetical protein
MLFVTICKARGTMKERLNRRLEYVFPKEVQVVGEYWLQTDDPAVVLVTECAEIAPMIESRAAWDDYFDISIFPAITAKEGLEFARAEMAKATSPLLATTHPEPAFR